MAFTSIEGVVDLGLGVDDDTSLIVEGGLQSNRETIDFDFVDIALRDIKRLGDRRIVPSHAVLVAVTLHVRPVRSLKFPSRSTGVVLPAGT